MSRIPREARDGIMRAWLEILRERHPGVTWLPLDDGSHEVDENTSSGSVSQQAESLFSSSS